MLFHCRRNKQSYSAGGFQRRKTNSTSAFNCSSSARNLIRLHITLEPKWCLVSFFLNQNKSFAGLEDFFFDRHESFLVLWRACVIQRLFLVCNRMFSLRNSTIFKNTIKPGKFTSTLHITNISLHTLPVFWCQGKQYAQYKTYKQEIRL